MLTENDVVNAVAAHLPSLGFTVESKCTTVQTGVDIVVKQDSSGRRLRIQAKGGTSSKEHTARYSLGFSPDRLEGCVTSALRCCGDAVRARWRRGRGGASDDEDHGAPVACISAALDKFGISVFFVAADKSVQVLSAADVG